MDPNYHTPEENLTESEMEQIYLSAIQRILNIHSWNETNTKMGEALVTVPAQPKQPHNKFSGYGIVDDGNGELIIA